MCARIVAFSKVASEQKRKAIYVDADASGDALNIPSFSVCLCRCVEIIAKEGRSLKELYLVSCKITDHGRILSITVPLLQSTSDIIIRTITTATTAAIQDPFDFTIRPWWDLQTVKVLLKSFTHN